MYVCICQAITDKQIKAAIQQGAHSLECLHQQLGVASQCGKCACFAKKILQESQTAQVVGWMSATSLSSSSQPTSAC